MTKPSTSAAQDVGQKNYAAVVAPRTKRPDLPAHKYQALNAKTGGDVDFLPIPKEFYRQQVDEFKFALIGRLMIRKGVKPRLTHELKAELQSLWNIPNDWQLITMGKGFFTLKFRSLEDKKTAKTNQIQELIDGQLRLREWVPKFNPYKEVSSIAQTWVHIYYLPIELWHPEVITAIGRYLGNPIKVDGCSGAGEVGHYARVLVEIDMSLPLKDGLRMDEDDGAFQTQDKGHNGDKDTSIGVNEPKKPDKEWQSKENSKKGQLHETNSGNRFEVLENINNEDSNGRISGPDLLEKAFTVAVEDSVQDNSLQDSLEDTREMELVVKGADVMVVDTENSQKETSANEPKADDRDERTTQVADTTCESERGDDTTALKALAMENALKIQKLESYIVGLSSEDT
ncbi:uncharacterized protein LOC131018949 [Salvia miltiorrhiza]|uniref:uncharacterized protein LOC131018949 n=1 Tax=Salvia miltiorrhiza TaxID=226208 RepID=UPI0025ACA181|nr:uncharacterized protein LOC131018949 [Salvia miltiorrhiza]